MPVPSLFQVASGSKMWPSLSLSMPGPLSSKQGEVLRALREGKVASVQGPDIGLRVDSVCVHSDTPNAVAVAESVRGAVAEYQGRAA